MSVAHSAREKCPEPDYRGSVTYSFKESTRAPAAVT